MEAPPDHPLHSFHAALRNLDKLERDDFREVIKSQFKPTPKEHYLTVNYHRAALNIEMMLTIKSTQQFQTLSLLARAIFELAVEMKSITLDPKAPEKIALFSQIELLRSSRRLVEYKTSHPDDPIRKDQQENFIKQFGPGIDAAQSVMWPASPTTGKKPSVKHWTLKNLRQRAIEYGSPFDRLYDIHYAQLSWLTHTGVVNPMKMTTNWVASFTTAVYAIAIDSYMEILEILVNEFKLDATNEHLKKKIVCNRDLGLTKTPAEAEIVMRRHGLWGYFEPPTPWAEAK